MNVQQQTNKTDIFFDLDHTLWDFEKNSALAFRQVIEELNLPFSIDEFLMYYVEINNTYWDKYSLNQITQDELRVGRISDTFSKLNYNSTLEEILEVGNRYIGYLPNHNHLFEGAIELLDYLKPKYKLHIITNGFSVVQEQKLRKSNIYDYFQSITDSELAGVKKPDSKIFEFAISSANATIEKSIMIGDNLIADVQGAQNIGMDVIFYNEHYKEVDSSIVQVNDLLEIKNLL